MIEKYKPFESTQFKKGRKLAKKQGLDMTLLRWGIEQLAQDIPLPLNWKDHQLKGNMKGLRECHIGGAGDWLLVYEKRDEGLKNSLRSMQNGNILTKIGQRLFSPTKTRR